MYYKLTRTSKIHYNPPPHEWKETAKLKSILGLEYKWLWDTMKDIIYKIKPL